MANNPALDELDRKANVDEAKRDLVLRFVRDQESLQTSQVDLKLVDDNTIDLIDSATNDDVVHDGVTGTRREEGQTLPPRPPAGRPKSRRIHKTTSHDTTNSIRNLTLSRVQSAGANLTSSGSNVEKACHSHPPGASNMDRFTRPMSPPPVQNSPLNSSWPEHDFVSRKLTHGRKYVLYSPERLDNVDNRPLSSISIGHNADGHNSRSTSPIKRQGSKSRARTFMNLNLEPVDPSEIPLLRGRSASSSVSGPYALVHLPPIQNTTPSM